MAGEARPARPIRWLAVLVAIANATYFIGLKMGRVAVEPAAGTAQAETTRPIKNLSVEPMMGQFKAAQ